MLVTCNNCNPVWVRAMLGEVHGSLVAFGESDNLAGEESRKAEVPRMKVWWLVRVRQRA